MRNRDTVVLVHGLGGSRLNMWPIARRLRQNGYCVINWGYRSVGNRIEAHVDRLEKELLSIDRQSENTRIHLVTHSMGGIIARAVFERIRPANLGRVVMLAPPHRGSHVARKLSPWIGWLTPCLQQLSDRPDSYVNGLSNSLKQNRIEFAVIEASRDRVIARGGVHLDGQKDFASVDVHHGMLSWHPNTVELVENFLKRGRFSTAGCELCIRESATHPV